MRRGRLPTSQTDWGSMRGASPVIIEGPDGAGKTKLALDLADHYEMEYLKPPPEVLDSTTGPAGVALVEWWDEQLARPPSELAMCVYDRCFYVSDPIYQMAQVERDLLVPPPTLARGIMKLWNAEPAFVFCLPEFATILGNVRKEGRPHLEGVSAAMLSKIWNSYWAYYAMWAQSLYENVVKYDYEEEGAWERLIEHFEVAV